MIEAKNALAFAALAALVGLSTVLVVMQPFLLVVVVGIVIALVIAAFRPQALAPVLVVVAIPMMRPNVLGELSATIALGLCLIAAVLSIASDKGRISIPRSYMTIVILMGMLYLWSLANASIFDADESSMSVIFQGFVTTGLAVLAAGFVLADEKRRRFVLRGFVWLVLAMCASFVVSFCLWLVAGMGSFSIATFATSRSGAQTATLFFPLTLSSGTQTVGGITFPRFTGLGREPGWMSLYCGLALLLWGRVGKPHWVGRLMLLAGLLGAFSTAGFGAFVVVIVVAWMGRKPAKLSKPDVALRFFGLIFKLVLLAGAAWLAFTAPVFGVSSKSELNAVSLEERMVSTNAGISAIIESPLGGVHTGVQEAINLIAAIAPLGLPYALLVIGMLYLPRMGHPAKSLTTAPVLLIFITLLLSQPIGDSTFIFIVTGLIYTCALPKSSMTDKVTSIALSPAYERMVRSKPPAMS